VGGALFMTDRDELDAGRREEIEHVHKSRPHNTAHVINAFCQECFDNRLTGRHFNFLHL